MDKKTGIIVGILVVVVLALIVVAVVADSNDPYLITINDVKYEKEGFEKYYRVRYFEEEEKLKAEEENKDEEATENEETPENEEATGNVETPENVEATENGATIENEEPKTVDKAALKETALNEYATALMINQIGAAKGYKPSESLIASIGEEYDAEEFNRDRLTELGISREDYIEAKKVVKMQEDFYGRLAEFYPIDDETFNNYMTENEDNLKGYDFRMMQFAITKNEEDGTTDKDAVLEKANAILERAKNGEDFETLAKENATSRIVINNSVLSQYNGELESVDSPYLSNYLNNTELYNALIALQPGEYTEIISDDSTASFIRLEALRDDVKDETKQAIRDELSSTNGMYDIYYSNPSVIINSRLLKTIEI